MYITSFSVIGIQYVMGDYLGRNVQTITDVYDPITGTTTPAGTELKPLFTQYTDFGTLNQVSLRTSTGNYSGLDRVIQYASIAASIAWDVLTLISGTQIFYMLFLFGVPYVFVMGMAFVYVFFLIRTTIAIIRGV